MKHCKCSQMYINKILQLNVTVRFFEIFLTALISGATRGPNRTGIVNCIVIRDLASDFPLLP